MNPTSPSNFDRRDEPNLAAPAPHRDAVRDALGNTWTAADLAAAAERAYLARQVLPAFDPSDPRAGA
jgi:hypothetical protein